MPDWNRIKKDYIYSADASLRKLADKYGVSFRQIRYQSDKGGWVAERAAHKDEIEAKNAKMLSAHIVTDGTIDTDCAAQVRTAALKSLACIQTMLDRVDEETSARDVKALTAAIKDIKEILMIKGEADIREQEARIKALEKQTAAEDDEEESGVILIPAVRSN